MHQPSTVRVYDPDSRSVAELRLSEFHREHFAVYLVSEKDSDRLTLKAYDEALAQWARITGDPPIQEITKLMLLEFQREAAKLPGRKGDLMSPFTVLKFVKHIRAVLCHAGPADPRHPDALGALATIPFARLPKTPRRKPRHVMRLDELGAMLDAAPSMWVPKHAYCKTADWWRALALFPYYGALRIGTLLQLEWTHIQGALLTVEDSARGLCKCDEGEEKELHVNILAALDRIRSPRRLVFEWPHCQRHLWRCLDRLQQAAGIPLERRKWMKFHGIRKRHGTQMALLSPLAAQLSLNHAVGSATMQQHYVSHAEITAKSIHQLPAPPQKPDDPQLKLFE